MKTINLTQHAAAPEQVAEGVFDPSPEVKGQIVKLLTIDDIPVTGDLKWHAEELAKLVKASGAQRAMIGGAPYLMAPLERALLAAGVQPAYAFSRRKSVEQVQPDGSVRKVAIFRHICLIGAEDKE